MSVIKDLKTDAQGIFAEGTFTSQSLFAGDMRICLFAEDGATAIDAEKCIEHYNHLKEMPQMMEQIENGLKPFFRYMYDEWQAFAYDDIAASLETVMEAYNAGDSLLAYLSEPTMYVWPLKDQETGYGIECECPWEPEHMCAILIRNDRVVYVGPSEGLDPWGEAEDYYCVWNDTAAA